MLNLRKRSIYSKHRALFILAGIVVEVVILAALIVLAVIVFGSAYFRVIEHPKFCGSFCHNMEASYASYKKSPHDGIRCAECHSRTGFVDGFMKDTIYAAAREIYIHMEGEDFYDMEEVRPRVSNESCLRHECHKVESLVGRDNLFAGDNIFKHSAHPISTELNCTSCHSQSKEKHMAVDQRVCFLCHSSSGGEVAATQDCNACHVIPAAQHETVMGDSSSCVKCHSGIEAEIEVPAESCAECHEGGAQHADMAHEYHIGPQHARCMDCHEPMKQKHGELTAHYDENCLQCHSAQDSMYQGKTTLVAAATPSPKAEMLDCDSCHSLLVEEGGESLSDIKGLCVDCHEEGYDEMADSWQEMIRDEIKEAEELLDSVAKSLKTTANKKASSLYEEARTRLLFVKKDGSLGVHNFDLADELLTDAIDKLEECQGMLK